MNDIGESYEDLITVSCKDLDLVDLSNIESNITKLDNAIEGYGEVEAIFPTKIQAFVKDLFEKADYINSLEEENPIKNGLIISHAMHANALESYASNFYDIYFDEYLKDLDINIEYSTLSKTNGNVDVTLTINKPHTIVNNNGSNIYTFTDNGEFKFEYEINGNRLEVNTKVSWIDKVKPTLTNINNGDKTYYGIVPETNDEDIIRIELY